MEENEPAFYVVRIRSSNYLSSAASSAVLPSCQLGSTQMIPDRLKRRKEGKQPR